MARGDAPISAIYRLGEAAPPGERLRARQEREASLFTILWQKYGLVCIRAEDLPQDDPLAQHVINIANEKYGRRNART